MIAIKPDKDEREVCMNLHDSVCIVLLVCIWLELVLHSGSEIILEKLREWLRNKSNQRCKRRTCKINPKLDMHVKANCLFLCDPTKVAPHYQHKAAVRSLSQNVNMLSAGQRSILHDRRIHTHLLGLACMDYEFEIELCQVFRSSSK
jgi:hypothetical protein